MTNAEIKQQLNNMRATLKAEEAKLVDSLNHIMGCEMLCERLMNEINAQPEVTIEEVPDNAEHQTD